MKHSSNSQRLSIFGAVAMLLLSIIGAGPPVAAAQSDVIVGGRTQSTDPTRHDYVAPGAAVTPMNAYGVGYVSPFSYQWNGLTIPLPSGYLFHSVSASGLTINSESVTYSPSPSVIGAIWGSNVCNARLDFQNRMGTGADAIIYTTWTGALLTGCRTLGISRSKSTTVKVKTGLQCARLFVAGSFRGEQCHNVFP